MKLTPRRTRRSRAVLAAAAAVVAVGVVSAQLVGTSSDTPLTGRIVPRTPENLALLLPPIPEGFTPVDPPGSVSQTGTCGGL